MSRFACWKLWTKYAWEKLAVVFDDGYFWRVIWTYEHAQCWYESEDLKQTPEGEEDVSDHGVFWRG